jgi:NADPH-dependent 2,4-dienoyl-CoA reductase/sulfur reductase-like enzyme
VAVTPEEFRDEYGIDARILHEVTEIDLKRRRLRVSNIGKKTARWEAFDQLLIATGAVPFCPDVPGSDARGIYGLHSLQSGIRVRDVIDRENPKKAVVIGGGYVGLEMAEALIMRGLDVSLVEQASQVMNTLDPDMGALVSDALMRVGVKLFREETFQAIEVARGRVRAVVTDHRTIPADIVILGLGVRPNTELAEGAGISLGVRKAIKTNDRMQTDIPGVWAAGDCAESFHLVSRRSVHIALGTIANKQGRVAGINLGGRYATFPGVVGTAVSKICDMEVARTGLQEKEIKALGLEYVTGRIESVTRAGYYPHAGKITVKALAEKGSGRLLGAQIVGVEGAAKRIDVFATALHAGFGVAEMINLDLSYAPPYSSVWDPVHLAVRRAEAALTGRL